MKNNIMILSLSVALLSTSAFAMEDAASAVALPAAPGGSQMAAVQAPLSAEQMAVMKDTVKARVFVDAYIDSDFSGPGFIADETERKATLKEQRQGIDVWNEQRIATATKANELKVPVKETDALVAFCERAFGLTNGWSFRGTSPVKGPRSYGKAWEKFTEADFEKEYQAGLRSLGLQG